VIQEAGMPAPLGSTRKIIGLKAAPYPLEKTNCHTMMQHDKHVHPLVNMGEWQVRDMPGGKTKKTYEKL